MQPISEKLSEKHLSHLDFSSRFKFIRHQKNPQLFSFLLMRDTETRRTVLAKNYVYDSKQQLNTILHDYQQLLKIYSNHPTAHNSASKINRQNNLNPYFCDFLGFCLERQNNDDLIYLLYDYHHLTLEQQINAKKLRNNKQKNKVGFSQDQINGFIESSLKALAHLQNYGMNFMCWSFRYILVQNLGNIDMKFRILFTPFLTDAVQQIQKQKPQIQDYFLSELQLQNLSKTTPNKQLTFSQKLLSDKQSLGLMALKLATVINEDDDRFYEMNQNFEVCWNSDGLKNRLDYLSSNYSSQVVRKIQYLIFEQKSFYSFKNYSPGEFSDSKFITFSGSKNNSIFIDKNINNSQNRYKKSRLFDNQQSSKAQLDQSSYIQKYTHYNSNQARRNSNQLFSTIKKLEQDQNNCDNQYLSHHHSNSHSRKLSNISNTSPSKIKKENYQTKLTYLQSTFMNKIPKQTMHRLQDPKIGQTYVGQIRNGRKQGLGINYNREGDVYFGQWSNDQMTGQGTYLFKNSDLYSGHIIKGKKHGHGRYQHWNGNIYEGQWSNDLKNGYGRYQYQQKGQVYEGQFINNLRSGIGQYIWKNGGKYQGKFNKGYKQGPGQAFLINGTKISGKWAKDVLEGELIQIQYSSGKIFKGGIYGEQFQGQGQEIDPISKYKCRGNYQKNKRNGYFQVQYSNGDRYSGNICEDKPEGKGTYFYAQAGITYTGSWLRGKQDGMGVLKFPNQTEIQCLWHNGKNDKMGKIRYSNGDQYCGEINGLGRNGRGVYVNSEGQTFKGVFKNGVLIDTN